MKQSNIGALTFFGEVPMTFMFAINSSYLYRPAANGLALPEQSSLTLPTAPKGQL